MQVKLEPDLYVVFLKTILLRCKLIDAENHNDCLLYVSSTSKNSSYFNRDKSVDTLRKKVDKCNISNIEEESWHFV